MHGATYTEGGKTSPTNPPNHYLHKVVFHNMTCWRQKCLLYECLPDIGHNGATGKLLSKVCTKDVVVIQRSKRNIQNDVEGDDHYAMSMDGWLYRANVCIHKSIS